MNPDEIKDLLADYLGDELSPSDRQRFEQYLTSDPDFAAEVEALRRTLSAMRSLEVPGQWSAPGVTAARTGVARGAILLRYAAVILLAFTGGFLVRGQSGTGSEPAPPSVVEPERPARQHDWQTRFASAYAENAGKSGLARSLVALAAATR